LEKAQEIRRINFGKEILFYAPSFMHYQTNFFSSQTFSFPTISVTGNSCALNCKHCGGQVLKTMYPAATPKKLFQLCKKLKRQGALGCLISGGCISDGSVPIFKFVDTIKKIKKDLGLLIFIHTGIIDTKTAQALKEAEVDAALIDIIGSNETITEIYNLNITVKEYENSLKTLNSAGIPFVPHLIVGLHYGELKGELNALQMVQKYNPSALVIIAFMPLLHTKMANIEPPKPIDIAKVMVVARLNFPKTPLALGCMRPKGKHRIKTDIFAINSGINAIAFPSEKAIKYVQKQGYNVSFSPLCCSQICIQ
jgi:hypothetical protein